MLKHVFFPNEIPLARFVPPFTRKTTRVVGYTDGFAAREARKMSENVLFERCYKIEQRMISTE